MTALVLALLLGATPAPVDPAAQPEVLRRIYEGGRNALVQVGSAPLSAGVVIDESGLVATSAAHVQGLTKVAVTFANGYVAPMEVVAIDRALGAALLRPTGLPPAAYLRLASTPAREGQAAYALHFQRALSPSVVFARVASTEVIRDGKVDDRILTARFNLSASDRGGAILGYGGELLGIILANDQTGTSFAVSSQALLAFVQAQAPKMPTTALSLSSSPAGAEVSLDGRVVGKTPLGLAELSAGAHLLVLRSKGLPDAVEKIVALGPATLKLDVPVLAGAQVTVQTLSGAAVFVDGILRGEGVTSLWLTGGRHWVAASLRGHRTFARWVEVVEDRPLVLSADLPQARATLSVGSKPPGAEVTLDGNRLGVTPLEKVSVMPGLYELTVSARGFHPAKKPVSLREGAEIDLGTLVLEPPRLTLRVEAPAQTEVALDDGPRHRVRNEETLAPGDHRAVFYAPYQYRTEVAFHGEDGQVVSLAPVFVAAGSPGGRAALNATGTVIEGAGGIALLIGGGFFLAAEADREGKTSGLTPTGRSSLGTGLVSGAIGLGLVAAGMFIESLQPTPEMGHDELAPAVSKERGSAGAAAP